MHAAWDLAHHLCGNPIWPFMPTSCVRLPDLRHADRDVVSRGRAVARARRGPAPARLAGAAAGSRTLSMRKRRSSTSTIAAVTTSGRVERHVVAACRHVREAGVRRAGNHRFHASCTGRVDLAPAPAGTRAVNTRTSTGGSSPQSRRSAARETRMPAPSPRAVRSVSAHLPGSAIVASIRSRYEAGAVGGQNSPTNRFRTNIGREAMPSNV